MAIVAFAVAAAAVIFIIRNRKTSSQPQETAESNDELGEYEEMIVSNSSQTASASRPQTARSDNGYDEVTTPMNAASQYEVVDKSKNMSNDHIYATVESTDSF